MRTIFSNIRPLFAAICSSVFVAACGGNGSSASPPTGGLQLDPGDGQITVSWVADPGVEYWLAYWPGTTVSTESNTAHIWAGTYHGVTSPFVQSGLYNGFTYAFSMNGRINGGPGGAGTPSVSIAPRPGGETWRAGTAMGTSTMRAVAYGIASDSIIDYVAVGDAAALYKSTDGSNWTAITTGPASTAVDFRAARYALGKFFAAGSAGQIYYSADMASWTASTVTNTTQPLNALASNGITLVAVGDNGTIRYSADGITWNVPTSVPTSEHLYAVSYSANGLWIAAGANGTVLTSSDTLTWTAQTSNTTANLTGIATRLSTVYTHVAIGSDGTVIKSTDGIAWTAANVGVAANLTAIVVPATGSQFLAVGSAGTAFTSPDGVTWTARTPSVAPNTCTAADWLGLISAQAQYVAVSSGGANCNSH
jgi:hypothetical protein